MKEQSLKWWSLLSPELKNHYCIRHKGTNNRCETLTVQEIIDIYQAEIVG